MPPVIQDLDASIHTLLERFLQGSGASVTFDRPGEGTAPKTAGAVNAYLVDITEKTDSRATGVSDVRGDGGRVIARQAPPRTFRFTYLVTAVAKDTAGEHQLLGSVLRGLIDHDTIPDDCLHGELVEPRRRIVLRIREDSPAPHDLFAAVGAPLRASLALEIDVPLLPTLDTEIAPPAEEIDLGVTDRLRGEGVEEPAVPAEQPTEAKGKRGRKEEPAPAPTPPLGPEARRWKSYRVRETQRPG